MRPFDHIEFIEVQDTCRQRWFACGRAIDLATRCYYSSSSSSANPSTLTTSGSAAPIVAGAGAAATSGSIAVGASGKYLESGAIDLSDSDLSTNISANAGSGGTVNITPESEDPVVNQLINALANGASIPVSVMGAPAVASTSTPVSTDAFTSFLDNINWTLIAILGAGIAALFIIFGRRNP